MRNIKRPIIGLNMDFHSSGISLSDHSKCNVNFHYFEAIQRAGGLPLPFPCFNDKNILEEFLEKVDGFMFIGGSDYPPSFYGEKAHPRTELQELRRSRTDLKIIQTVLKTNLPILGICAGAQLINIAHGGRLIQHLPRSQHHQRTSVGHRTFHNTTIIQSSRLASIFESKSIRTNSSHHQAVDPNGLGRNLRIAAKATDGTVEAIEAKSDRFIVGVQWHPESMKTSVKQEDLFKAFINEAKQTR